MGLCPPLSLEHQSQRRQCWSGSGTDHPVRVSAPLIRRRSLWTELQIISSSPANGKPEASWRRCLFAIAHHAGKRRPGFLRAYLSTKGWIAARRPECQLSTGSGSQDRKVQGLERPSDPIASDHKKRRRDIALPFVRATTPLTASHFHSRYGHRRGEKRV